MSVEYFPIVNPDGTVVGKASRQECHSGSKLLHPVVHLHVIDKDGRYFLQQRSFAKDIQPGKWDTAVGGHVDYGEDIETSLLRECKEELNIVPKNPFHLITYIFESEIERELINSYGIIVDSEGFRPTLNREEIIDGKFWSVDEIEEARNAGVLTPNFLSEYDRIKDLVRELL